MQGPCEKIYNLSVLIKNKIAVFRLPARAAEMCPCENELRLQSDFDLQAVELDSTSLALFLPSFVHSFHQRLLSINYRQAPCWVLWERNRRTSEDDQALVSFPEEFSVLSGRQTCKHTIIEQGTCKTQTNTYYRSQINHFLVAYYFGYYKYQLYCLRVSN